MPRIDFDDISVGHQWSNQIIVAISDHPELTRVFEGQSYIDRGQQFRYYLTVSLTPDRWYNIYQCGYWLHDISDGRRTGALTVDDRIPHPERVTDNQRTFLSRWLVSQGVRPELLEEVLENRIMYGPHPPTAEWLARQAAKYSMLNPERIR